MDRKKILQQEQGFGNLSKSEEQYFEKEFCFTCGTEHYTVQDFLDCPDFPGFDVDLVIIFPFPIPDETP